MPELDINNKQTPKPDGDEFLNLVAEVKEMPDQSRVARFVGTTGTRDRMGDEVAVKGWQCDTYLQTGGPFLWAHNYSDVPIGRTIAIREETVNGKPGLSFDVEFAPADIHPKAEQLFQLVKRGFLKAVSVGFRSLDSAWIEETSDEKKARESETPDVSPGKLFRRKELLELSLVPVPANPEALLIEVQRGLAIPDELKREIVATAAADMVTKTAAITEKPVEHEPEPDKTLTFTAISDGNVPPVDGDVAVKGAGEAQPTPPVIAVTQPEEVAIADTAPAPSPATPISTATVQEDVQTTKENTTMAENATTPNPEIAELKSAMAGLADAVKNIGETVKELRPAPTLVPPPTATASETPTTTPVKTFNVKRNSFVLADDAGNEPCPRDEFSFVRAALAQTSGDWSHAEYERYVHDVSTKKTIAWASGSAGGYWVSPEFLPERFYMDYTANIVARKAGIQVVPFNSAPVNIPRVSAGGTAYWLAQNTTITESSPTPNQFQMTPKWCCARVQISKFLAQTSQPAAEQIVRREMARRLSLAVDYAVLHGPGTSGKPTGLTATGSINTVAIGTNGGAVTPAHLYSMLYALEYDDVPQDGLAFVMHPRTWNYIRQILVGADTNNYLFFQSVPNAIANAAPPYLLGYPVYLSTQVVINRTKGSATTKCASIILANFKECILGEWGGIAVDVTDIGGNAWIQNALEFRAVLATDVGVLNANAVCHLADNTDGT
jgi:HK97 family phage major capsid protein/HK97 family phage prohead protease